jgi:excisionase family DNA binding protein
MTRPVINFSDHQSTDSNWTNPSLKAIPEKLLLTEVEAAKALGISPRTLWTLRDEGKIPFVRIGKCVRYSIEALKKWIAEHGSNRDEKKLPR